MRFLTCPDCAARVQPEDLICFRCGANLPRGRLLDEDPPTPPTITQRYLGRDEILAAEGGATCPSCGSAVPDPADVVCTVCREPLTRRGRISPVVLRLAFPTGNVEVPAGTSVLLGRDPEESLVAAAFAQFDNVSRRHATVTVDDAGHASVRDEHSTNGTFVNGDRVLSGVDVRLADGDRLRLAADVTADVSLPRQEPNPATLTRETTA